MKNEPIESGARPALAAHSKDASVAGLNPAAEASAKEMPGPRSSERARNAAGSVASSMSQAARTARQHLPDSVNAAETMTNFTREQPALALLVAGMVGVMIGVLLARR